MCALLPEAVRRRCPALVEIRTVMRPSSIAWAALAIVIGAATHIIWDAFTHEDRWGTRLIPALDETALIVMGLSIPGYKLLQYGSSFIGLAFLMVFLVAWLSRQEPRPVDEGPVLGLVSKVAISLALIAIPLSLGIISASNTDLTMYGRLGITVRTGGLALMLSTLVYGLAFLAVEAWYSRPK